MKSYHNLSFEFFPPKTAEGEKKLQATWRQLASLNPKFFSVTFGAGGSTREKTAETVVALQNDIKMAAAPHISCIGSTRADILELLNYYREQNIKNLVVLRGDYPSGTTHTSGDFNYANELVAFIREQTGKHFNIHVAAYPEFHPEARNCHHDLTHFKRKIDAGADIAITQYFYNADAYFYFVDSCKKQGITVPIIPGIMPIQNVAGLKRFSERCGSEIPTWLEKRLHALDEDVNAIQEFGIEVVTKLCEKLIHGGAPGFHFYTLNHTEPTLQICKNLQA